MVITEFKLPTYIAHEDIKPSGGRNQYFMTGSYIHQSSQNMRKCVR